MGNDDASCGRGGRVGRLLTLAAILAICAAVRIWLICNTEVIAGDGTTYVAMARQWHADAAGVIDRYHYHPGYPAVMAGVHDVLDAMGLADGRAGWELAGQVVSLVASLAATAAVWCFAVMAFNARVAWISALLFGVGRKWAGLGADVLTEALAVCLQLWALVLAVTASDLLKKKSRWALAAAAGAGICGGAGYLVRPEALIVVVLAILLWLTRCSRERLSRRLTLGAVASAAVTAAACSVPYMIAIGGLSKKKTLGELILHSGAKDGVAKAGALAFQVPLILSSVLTLVAETFEAMHPVVGVLACVWLVVWVCGKWVLRRRPEGMALVPRRECGFMMVGVTVVFAVMLIGLHANVGYLSERHAMFPAAVLSPFAGAGIIVAVGGIAALGGLLRLPPRPQVISLGVTAVICAAMVCFHTLRPLHEDKAYFRRAAEFVSRLAGPKGLVLVDDAWLGHYSSVPCKVVIPTNRGRIVAQRFRRQIIESAATYLALSDKKTIGPKWGVKDPGPDPKLKELLAGPGISQVRVFEGSGVNPVKVYRVDRQRLRAKSPAGARG